MGRHRKTSRPRWTLTLLGCTGVLTAVLAYEAWDASRSSVRLAEESVRDQALFAASNFAFEARGEVGLELLEEGLAVIESSEGRRGNRPLTLGRVREAARARRWDAMDQAALFFRLDPRGGELSVAGEADSAEVAWAVGEVREHTRRNPDDFDVRVLFAAGGSRVMVHGLSYEGRGDYTVRGMILSPTAFRPALDRAFREEPLLPEAISGGRANEDIFLARVRGPYGEVVYESAGDSLSGIAVRYDLDESFGGMVLELGVRAEAIDQLVSGGVPQLRMPYIVALLVLTCGLLATALWQLRREAELATLREDFVSSVSHQLRTPLTQIRMFGETLVLGRVRDEAERSRAAEIIVDEADRLAHQVENVLLFSRGERDALNLNPVEADLGALVERVAESFEPLARVADVTVERRIETGIVCVTDVEATRQAVLNLLDNAVKYGPAGQVVEFGVRSGARAGFATVWVEDEGPGVPPGQGDRIWEAYVRLDRDRASATAGSGIGLAVVREVIEAQGGTVRVEESRRTSETGARFVIELPLANRSTEA
ncbi:HAMP domain-containing sensor histidine kinase [Candidatus Palauibacter polyketidifaciens]|uniref:sensor histidine kinase n=1 Tax=Candidatus Palauibacter polyketidifaciens TaxID=3056740 RepID=UPI002389771A|nr:HAMP domain-containing sensor histidine kinase [Candidatus Palauibacter polyketidifaciens]MDE2721473.1 HAMP domain-containing sensor histidine kinase [Candidatus Palauibacter polyketidifaciens]